MGAPGLSRKKGTSRPPPSGERLSRKRQAPAAAREPTHWCLRRASSPPSEALERNLPARRKRRPAGQPRQRIGGRGQRTYRHRQPSRTSPRALARLKVKSPLVPPPPRKPPTRTAPATWAVTAQTCGPEHHFVDHDRGRLASEFPSGVRIVVSPTKPKPNAATFPPALVENSNLARQNRSLTWGRGWRASSGAS